MIHGVIHDGTILPLDPIPSEWGEGRQVVIEPAREPSCADPAALDKWYAAIEAMGAAQYEPGERDAIDKIMARADRDAKEFVRRSWAECQ